MREREISGKRICGPVKTPRGLANVFKLAGLVVYR